MPPLPGPKHFEGQDALTHLKKARQKGALATAETHGAEVPGHISAGAGSAKETALLLFILWILFSKFTLPLQTTYAIYGLTTLGWFFWKMGRSALLGWARLERLHRLIEEERFEIEHHRDQEKEELIALYKQKGFQGKLLDQVIEILMADDNRLLEIMLEEELGLTLESYEHPIKQGLGAGLGVIIAAALGGSALFFNIPLFIILAFSCIFIFSTLLTAKLEGNNLLRAFFWNLSLGTFTLLFVYFAAQMVTVAS